MTNRLSQTVRDAARARIVSYSQNAEDVRLWRIFADTREGFYVDVGAAHPSVGSATRLFYDHGWSGVNVEPGPVFDELAAARPRDVNLRIAIGQHEGDVPFFLTYPDLGMSTLDLESHAHVQDAIEHFEEIAVRQRRLESVLREHATGRTIHFLKIDVEGAERDVLASSDWSAFRPIVVLLEAVKSWTAEQAHDEWEPLLLNASYVFAAFDGINRFYVESDHRELAPDLARPISALDSFTTRQEEEARARIEEARARVEELERRLWQLQSERDRLRVYEDAVAAMYRSRTWRAGRALAALASPLMALAGRPRVKAELSIPVYPSSAEPTHPLSPSETLAATTASGQPWHFPRARTRSRKRREARPLELVLEAFGPIEQPLGRERAETVLALIERTGWANEESLLDKRFAWDERQALVEADAVARTVARGDEAHVADDETTHFVVDARCLQDPSYRDRGVGLHSRAVFAAAREAAPDARFVLLTDVELPPLDALVRAMADEVMTSLYPLRDDHVEYLLQLSPMTASAASLAPLLASPTTAKASVVYDFIPSEFPDAYLESTTAALQNRVRIEALRQYDVLLPISAATEANCRRYVGDAAVAVTTGVADPLHDVVPTPPSVEAAFALVPTGGDPRKNAIAAIIAVASQRRAADEPLRAVVTGARTPAQDVTIDGLVRQLELPADAVEMRGAVAAEELARLYHAAEVVIVPSIAEGFSIPVAEAVLRGTPVVASDIPAHRELIGEGPWLADPNDVDDLERALREVREARNAVVSAQRESLGTVSDPAAVADRVTTALELLFSRPIPRPSGQRPRRSRPQIALITPFPPHRSGVADYTAFTFREIAKHADVELFSTARTQAGDLQAQPVSGEPFLTSRFDAVVGVVGNSHFHFPVLDLLGAFGGACIAHDNRMIESYLFDRGEAWTAQFLAPEPVASATVSIPELLANLDRLANVGYGIVARQATPLIVHGRALADRILEETGVEAAVAPFVPYNVPDGAVDEATRGAARAELGLEDGLLHVGTFGYVDRRTKGVDMVVGAAGWLRTWGIPAHLHIVGDGPEPELRALTDLATELGVATHVTQHRHVPTARLRKFLVAVDVAVQLRTSAILSLSGAVADCLAFGVPTVTSTELARELEAPSYAAETGAATSSLLIAEAIDGLRDRRRTSLRALEQERAAYVSRRSVSAYARAVLDALGLAAA